MIVIYLLKRIQYSLRSNLLVGQMRIVIDLTTILSPRTINRGIGRYAMALTKSIIKNKKQHDVFVLISDDYPNKINLVLNQLKNFLPKKNIILQSNPDNITLPTNIAQDLKKARSKVPHKLKQLINTSPKLKFTIRATISLLLLKPGSRPRRILIKLIKKSVWLEKITRELCIRKTKLISLTKDSPITTTQIIRNIIFKTIEPDILLHLNIIEYVQNIKINSSQQNYKNAVICYDLIPLLIPEKYLTNTTSESTYKSKIAELEKSDLILTISQSSKNEALQNLSLKHDTQVENILADADQHFRPTIISKEQKQEILAKFKINNDFVMYTGGIDYRKNIEGLITAFALIPEQHRKTHSLVIVCNISNDQRKQLEKVAKDHDLHEGELILTGFVTDKELLMLYNLCKLFVFPSLHEGFGLPILEAMRCGKAVIGSNASSIPEVIGLDQALFAPNNPKEIADKITLLLTDDEIRQQFEQHSLQQAKQFSWDKSGKKAIQAFEKLINKQPIIKKKQEKTDTRKLKLAFVTPLPPEKTGIAYYTADLLPELNKFYQIDIISPQKTIDPNCLGQIHQTHDPEWFKTHYKQYDRIIYNMGNNDDFHAYMVTLLEVIPGVVVLHDFFLNNMFRHFKNLPLTLYKSYGYSSLNRYLTAPCPTNLTILQDSLSLIMHSKYCQNLIEQHYGPHNKQSYVINLLKNNNTDKTDVKKIKIELGLPEDSFIISSFGILGLTKYNHLCLDAFLQSSLIKQNHVYLIFVGHACDDYKRLLSKKIKQFKVGHRIKITGWTTETAYKKYLAITDMAIQLRQNSNGETSGTVLDCMGNNIPIIVNAVGSMAEIPDDCVKLLNQQFTTAELSDYIEQLYLNDGLREKLQTNALNQIKKHHSPKVCAEQYFNAIEKTYSRLPGWSQVIQQISNIEDRSLSVNSMKKIAVATVKNFPLEPRNRQLFVDITGIISRHKGIDQAMQNRVGAEIISLLKSPHVNYNLQPVYQVSSSQYKCANVFMTKQLYRNNIPYAKTPDINIDMNTGDILLISYPDEAILNQACNDHFFDILYARGIRIAKLGKNMSLNEDYDFFSIKDNLSIKEWLLIGTNHQV